MGLCIGALAPVSAAQAADCGGLLVPARDWADGNGVDVHSNGAKQGTGDSCAGSMGRFDLGAKPPRWGMGWQCVELAARLYKTHGWSNGLPGVSYAAQIYPMAKKLGMSSMAQGAIDIGKIVAGDMIVSDQASYGHVSVVSSVDVVAGKVFAVEQNASSDGWATYTYDASHKKLSRGSYYNVSGVVHDPDNTWSAASTNGFSAAPQIFQVKRTADPSGTRQVYAATNTAITEAWWVPGRDGVHLHEVIRIAQQNIVGFDKVNLPGATQAVYTAVSDGVFETWWKPDGSTSTGRVITGLNGVKGVFAHNTVESEQLVHHLYILAADGPYEAWWKDGDDGVHLSRLADIRGGTTFTMDASGSVTRLYVATPTWVYEVSWLPGSNDIQTRTVVNVTQGDIRHLEKVHDVEAGTHRLYTTTSTTVWESAWFGDQGAVRTTAKVVAQVGAMMSKELTSGDVEQLYLATSDHVQEYWRSTTGSGGSTLVTVSQGTITAIDVQIDGAAHQLYAAAGSWVYETWWGGGSGPRTTGLFSVSS